MTSVGQMTNGGRTANECGGRVTDNVGSTIVPGIGTGVIRHGLQLMVDGGWIDIIERVWNVDVLTRWRW